MEVNMKNNYIKNINASLNIENMKLDNNTKVLLENYFDGRFSSDQILEQTKQIYLKK